MTKYCKKCGEPNENNAEFCNQCGYKFDGVTNNKSNFIEKLPLILAILSILIGFIEGLTAPMLFGIYEIIASILVVVIGGIIGLFLMKKQENFIAGLEFIAIAIVLFTCLSNMALIGTILFIITALVIFYLKGMKYSSKKLFSIPILTIVLVIGILTLGGSISFVNNQNSVEIGNITQNIVKDYDYYSGDVMGDIRVDAPFDYLEVHMDFYDASGKVCYSTIAWNELNIKGGETYHFSGMYFDEIQPTKVKITIVDNSNGENPLYNETIEIATM